jgi:hypothetical protein
MPTYRELLQREIDAELAYKIVKADTFLNAVHRLGRVAEANAVVVQETTGYERDYREARADRLAADRAHAIWLAAHGNGRHHAEDLDAEDLSTEDGG